MKSSLHVAFDILKRHPDCIKDDVSLNDLMTDIADAIDRAGHNPSLDHALNSGDGVYRP